MASLFESVVGGTMVTRRMFARIEVVMMTDGKMGGPRKRAGEKTATSYKDFADDDEVRNLLAVKTRLAEMLARPDLLERDMAALNKDYRKVITELKDARDRAASAALGRRNGPRAVTHRSFDGDI